MQLRNWRQKTPNIKGPVQDQRRSEGGSSQRSGASSGVRAGWTGQISSTMLVMRMHAHQCFETTRPSSTSKASGRREQRGGGSGMPVACKRWRKCSTGRDDRRAQRCWIWVGTQPMTTHVTRSAEEERGAAAQKTAVDRLSGMVGRAGCACAHLTVTIDDRLMKRSHNCGCHADGQKWR